jgi:hypothetical protein
MIVTGISQMKRYLPSIEMKGEPEVFNGALEAAQEKLVDELLGIDLEELLEDHPESHPLLLPKVKRVISLSAFLSSIAEMDLVLTDAGFAVISNQDMAPASRERVDALKLSLQVKLDEATDRLISYLYSTSTYDDWRGTEQFSRLSDALIMTFIDFKDSAVLNNITLPFYPKTWGDFYRLNSALNVALMTNVASYISKDYALELLEKIKDREMLLPAEKAALKHIKCAICAYALGDGKTGQDQTMAALAVMKSNIDDFPTFAASPEAAALTCEHSKSPIFSML